MANNLIRKAIMTQSEKYPKISDLPPEEQAAFRKWLTGQTVPVNEQGESCYYQHDYERWKAGKPVID
jgi:hypothetical protein